MVNRNTRQGMKSNSVDNINEFLGINEMKLLSEKLETKYPDGKIPIIDPDYIKLCELQNKRPSKKEMGIFFRKWLKLYDLCGS